jgi:preprotein translocase subunit SecE
MFEKLRISFDATVDELVNKTTWPTWDELQDSAIVTLISALLIAFVIFLMDTAFDNLFNMLYKLTQ